MVKTIPVPVDDGSLAEGALGLERHLNGMAENLAIFQPTMGLTGEGRLMYALAKDPYGPTHAMYPVGGYAKPLKPESVTARHRLQRVKGNAMRLRSRLEPFMVQTLPADGDACVMGHATAVGFMSARGLDVCWNGKGWHVTPGFFEFSAQLPENPKRFDTVIHEHHFDGDPGLVYVEFAVEMLPGRGVRIIGVSLKFKRGGPNMMVCDKSNFRIDATRTIDHWYVISPATVISPIAYVMPPQGERKAPVVLRMGHGEFPWDYNYTIPWSSNPDGVQPYDE